MSRSSLAPAMTEKLGKLLAPLAPIADRYHSFGFRGRVVATLIVCSGLAFLVDSAWLLPQREAIARFERKIDRSVSKGREAATEMARINADDADPDAAVRAQRDGLIRTLVDLDEQLAEQTALLVAPTDVPGLLRGVLARHPGVKLVRADSLPPAELVPEMVTSVRAPAANTAGREALSMGQSEPNVRLYEHGLRLKFSATYLGALAYLRDVEALPWELIWREATFEATDYPNGVLTIDVATLSGAEQWIGLR